MKLPRKEVEARKTFMPDRKENTNHPSPFNFTADYVPLLSRIRLARNKLVNGSSSVYCSNAPQKPQQFFVTTKKVKIEDLRL